jgi:transcriptional regulator with XRE-family HTH domain
MDHTAQTRMRAERLRRRWTQTDLGSYARMSAAEISRIESGRLRPYAGQARRLAEILGLDPDQLQELAAE